MGLVPIKLRTTGATSSGLKLQCITIATFSLLFMYDHLCGILLHFDFKIETEARQTRSVRSGQGGGGIFIIAFIISIV